MYFVATAFITWWDFCFDSTDPREKSLCSAGTEQLCKATSCIPVSTHCQSAEAICEAEEGVIKGPPKAIFRE